MQKAKTKLSKKELITGLKAKHESAVWKVEQLWRKMPARDYAVRKNIVEAAMGLVEIEQEINILAKTKVKKA